MKKLFEITLAALCAVMIFSSCVNSNNIRVGTPGSVRLRGMSNLEFVTTVENSSSSKIKIEKASFTVKDDGVELIQLVLREPIIIPRKSMKKVTVNLKLNYSNPLVMLSLAGRMENRTRLETMTVSGEMKGRAGIAIKRFKLKDMPLTEFISKFGNITSLLGNDE